MKHTEHVHDRTRLDGLDVDVDIEVESHSGQEHEGTDVAKRLADRAFETIERIAAEQDQEQEAEEA